MNRAAGLFVIVVLVVALVTPASGTSISKEEARGQSASIGDLVATLQSGGELAQENAAYLLGEMKSVEAVIPLMRMLHENTSEAGRTVAALALCKIGDGRGVFAVKRAVEFDASKKVQKRCAWFYDQYVQHGSFTFTTVPAPEEPIFGAR